MKTCPVARAVAVVLCLFCLYPAEGDEVDDFFEVFTEKRDQVLTLAVDFVQRNTTPEAVYRAEGSILYIQPSRIIYRIETEEDRSVFLVDQQRLYEYDSALQQLQVYSLEEGSHTEILFMGFDDDSGRLRKAYDVTLFEPETGVEGARALRLTPKSGPDRDEPLFREVRLYLEPEYYLPYRIEVDNDAESGMIIEVGERTVNGPMAPHDSQIRLAPGTKIIEDGSPAEVVGEDGRLIPEPATLLLTPHEDMEE